MNDLRHDPDATRPSDAFANVREQVGAYFDAIPDVDAWVSAVRRGDDPPAPAPDLRTADQRHADELADLRTEVTALSDKLDDMSTTLHRQAQGGASFVALARDAGAWGVRVDDVTAVTGVGDGKSDGR